MAFLKVLYVLKVEVVNILSWKNVKVMIFCIKMPVLPGIERLKYNIMYLLNSILYLIIVLSSMVETYKVGSIY